MTDTAASVDARLRELLRQRSASERVRMATGMFGSAKRLALAGLRHGGRHRDAVAERLGLLERLHGDELSPAVRAIVAARAGESESGATPRR
ncbi:MAG: hypothetical protein KF709_05345 [Gemmatimonadaceae bacterium]|nr:hypothetical protein [Gemmatimonadaceae bacterium]